MQKQQLILIHRGLHLENIIHSKDYDAIIDFGEAAFAHPLVTFARTYIIHYEDIKFRNVFAQKMREKISQVDNFENIFFAFVVYTAIHLLTAHVPSARILRYIRPLCDLLANSRMVI